MRVELPLGHPLSSRTWHRKVALAAVIAVAIGGCGSSAPPSVWVDNRSAEAATFFVDDLGTGPAPYYIVAAHTSAHVGSDGLGTREVRVNVLGWGHEAGNVGPCSPGQYDDTLYDVPAGGSVRLLIDVSGQPSVGLASEPPSLPRLERAPLDGRVTEEQLCQRIHELRPGSSTRLVEISRPPDQWNRSMESAHQR